VGGITRYKSPVIDGDDIEVTFIYVRYLWCVLITKSLQNFVKAEDSKQSWQPSNSHDRSLISFRLIE
jgi:hypothetical protein